MVILGLLLRTVAWLVRLMIRHPRVSVSLLAALWLWWQLGLNTLLLAAEVFCAGVLGVLVDRPGCAAAMAMATSGILHPLGRAALPESVAVVPDLPHGLDCDDEWLRAGSAHY